MKKLLAIALIISTLIALCSCTMIKDTNGADDTSLCTITDEDIINGMTPTAILTTTFSINERYSIGMKYFSGVDDIAYFDMNGEDITVTLSAEVKKGNFAVVLVNDGKIVGRFDTSGEDSTVTLEKAYGYVYIRAAGESANFKVNFTYSVESNKQPGSTEI